MDLGLRARQLHEWSASAAWVDLLLGASRSQEWTFARERVSRKSGPSPGSVSVAGMEEENMFILQDVPQGKPGYGCGGFDDVVFSYDFLLIKYSFCRFASRYIFGDLAVSIFRYRNRIFF